MSDIVERLLDNSLHCEAIREIERLRDLMTTLLAENKRLLRAFDGHCRPCLGLASTAELRAELEARTGSRTAPEYRTIGDLDGYRKAYGLSPLDGNGA